MLANVWQNWPKVPRVLVKNCRKDSHFRVHSDEISEFGRKTCSLRRARKVLQSKCLLVKIGFATAENEPSKVCSKVQHSKPEQLLIAFRPHLQPREHLYQIEILHNITNLFEN